MIKKKKKYSVYFNKFFKGKKALDLSFSINLCEAKIIKSILEKYPLFLNITFTQALGQLISRISDNILDKAVKCLEKYQPKDLNVEVITFIIRLCEEASKQKDDSLIDKVLTKIPIKLIGQFRHKKILTKLLICQTNKPWFDLLTYEQITTISPFSLDKIAKLEDEIQTLILNDLKITYKNKLFKLSKDEVEAFVAIAQDQLRKQKEAMRLEANPKLDDSHKLGSSLINFFAPPKKSLKRKSPESDSDIDQDASSHPPSKGDEEFNNEGPALL